MLLFVTIVKREIQRVYRNGCRHNERLHTNNLFLMNQESEILKGFYLFIYYESTKYICECRCYERLQTKTKEFTRLSYTELVLELEHLKIETRFEFIMNQ
jgi:hypothetical protein